MLQHAETSSFLQQCEENSNVGVMVRCLHTSYSLYKVLSTIQCFFLPLKAHFVPSTFISVEREIRDFFCINLIALFP